MSEAPNAVDRLRQLVLDLAIRGKLVEQQADPEPADVLLGRILLERQPSRRGANEAGGAPVNAWQAPFGWTWTSLGEIGIANPRNTAPVAQQVGFVPMAMIPAEYGKPHAQEHVPWGSVKTGYTHFTDGDVAVAKITPCFENGKSVVFEGLLGGIGAGTTELHVLRPVLVNPKYILLYLKSAFFIESGKSQMTGTAGQKRLPRRYFLTAPFPMPPLAEQHRIVAKVDEMMSLCDELEAGQAERERRRDRLATASLRRVSRPAEGEGEVDRQAAATFHIAHLDRMVTRPEQIGDLRSCILSLATRGRLIPQEPGDEPAEQLLAAVARDKERMISEGNIKPLRAMLPVHDDDVPHELPPTWRWVRTETICEIIVDCPHSTPVFVPSGIMCLDTNCFKNGQLLPHKVRFVSEETYRDRVRRLIPQAGDVVFAREGSVGASVIVPPNTRCCLGQRVMLFRPMTGITPRFFSMALSEADSLDRLRTLHKGIGAKHVNVADMRNALLPLPPLASQHRIVSRVDELMAICDRLEAQLASGQAVARGALDAVLHAALAAA